MRKKQDNTLFIFIILVILLFILPLTFSPTNLGIQASPPKEALAGSIVLVILALIIYFSEKTYKYTIN